MSCINPSACANHIQYVKSLRVLKLYLRICAHIRARTVIKYVFHHRSVFVDKIGEFMNAGKLRWSLRMARERMNKFLFVASKQTEYR